MKFSPGTTTCQTSEMRPDLSLLKLEKYKRHINANLGLCP